MVFFLHSVEGPQGRWTCQRGRVLIDPNEGHHPGAEEAVSHLREVARSLEGRFDLTLHFLDGSLMKFDTDLKTRAESV